MNFKQWLTDAFHTVETQLISLSKITEEHLRHVSAETLNILTIILLHSATLPSYVAMTSGIESGTPDIDVVLLLWMGLATMFAQSLVRRDMISLTVNAMGFMMQSMIMAMIFFY